MESILYVGMDVHTSNFTLCTYSIEDDREFGKVKFGPDYLNIVRYVNRMKEQHGKDTRIICGYEAGGLGYSLYIPGRNQLQQPKEKKKEAAVKRYTASFPHSCAAESLPT